MDISGGCHCGNIAFVFSIEPDPAEIAARACGCSFCVKHGGVWTSSPTASLRIDIKEEQAVSRYAFGTRTAQFHVCQRCGVVPLATSTIEGQEYAVVNVNTFENIPSALLRHAPASFEGEGEGDRLARRAKNWIADVGYGPRPSG